MFVNYMVSERHSILSDDIFLYLYILVIHGMHLSTDSVRKTEQKFIGQSIEVCKTPNIFNRTLVQELGTI